MNRLIIFDLDGTLFESRQMHYDTLNSALEYYGIGPISLEDHNTRLNGMTTANKLALLCVEGEEADLVRREKQRMTLAWVMKNVQRNEALVALFTHMRSNGWKVAVASNAITMTVIRSLQLLGLWKLCDFIVAGDQVTFPKPDPAMYLHCMEACGAEPSGTWIIEDSLVGREGARRSGANVVAINGPEDVFEAVRRILEVA